jgi:KilA-N domain
MALANSVKSTELELVQASVGNRPTPERGTWAHPKLAVFFARWLDVRFSVNGEWEIVPWIQPLRGVVHRRPRSKP